jgi:predicted flap endonuclease-1-like 5' DNA nuclease
MDFENMNIWCWLIPLLVGAICGILGYLLGSRGGDTTIDNSADLKLLEDKNARLQADLDACNKKATASTNLAASTASFAAGAAIASIPFDAAAAKAAFGKSIKQDDLKVVEGIGPKIEGMFKEAGIKTWKSLSETSVADCQKVLDGGGKRYQVHNPASWPMQSKMAYEGKWKELSKWQDEHDHGKL